MKTKLIAIAIVAVALISSADARETKLGKVPWRERISKNDNTYDQWLDWYNELPPAAKRFPGADRAYWRKWYQRGISPEFAWRNTDPRQTHVFSRPKLKGEK